VSERVGVKKKKKKKKKTEMVELEYEDRNMCCLVVWCGVRWPN
jgi:hypothetical protein